VLPVIDAMAGTAFLTSELWERLMFALATIGP